VWLIHLHAIGLWAGQGVSYMSGKTTVALPTNREHPHRGGECFNGKLVWEAKGSILHAWLVVARLQLYG
jgi:hypothetical protein